MHGLGMRPGGNAPGVVVVAAHTPYLSPLPSHKTQVAPARVASVFSGSRMQPRAMASRPAARPALAVVCQAAVAAAEVDEEERLRLFNLSPQPGSKKSKTRKGRGYGAGQVRA